MYEHLHEYYIQKDHIDYDHKTIVSERFLDKYTEIEASDLYRWLWEGEFGPGMYGTELTLDILADDIRAARIKLKSKKLNVWEDAGLSMKLIRVNIVAYADHGCPLKRLIHLHERTRDIRPDILHFKQDWAFVKTQVSSGMTLTTESVREFENGIPFHMAPEVDYSPKYKENYGLVYKLVPRVLFFTYFPEYTL